MFPRFRYKNGVSNHEIGHGNTLSLKKDEVELRHFGKTVKKMTRREFVAEFPLLAYMLGQKIMPRVGKIS